MGNNQNPRRIAIGGMHLDAAHIVSSEIDHRHYANGSTTLLVIVMSDGGRLTFANGRDVDVYQAQAKITDWQCKNERPPP